MPWDRMTAACVCVCVPAQLGLQALQFVGQSLALRPQAVTVLLQTRTPLLQRLTVS